MRTALTEANDLEYHRPNGWNELACLLLETAIVRGFHRSVREASGSERWILLAQRLLAETRDDMDTGNFQCSSWK